MEEIKSTFSQTLSDQSASIEVHTMPPKFLSVKPSFISGKSDRKVKKSGGLKKNLFIGLAAILVVGGLLILAAWLFLKNLNQNKTNVVSPPVAVEEPNMAENLDLEQEVPATSPTPSASELPAEDQILEFNKWLDFDNSAYNYSLKYPAQWQVEKNDNPSQPASALEVVTFEDQSGTEPFIITIFSNLPAEEPLLDWLKSNFDIDESELESFSLHSHSAYKYEDLLDNTYTVYLLSTQKVYSLTFLKTDDNILNQAYAQLLINFKISEPVQEPPEASVVTPALDSDHDNLTDMEEELYKSDKNRRDTDGDNYIDGDEVANLYDPTIAGSSRLYNSPVVSTYVNSNYNYNIVYPTSWTSKGEDDSIIFQDKNGEFVQILIVQNEDNHPDIEQWYRETIYPETSQLTHLNVAGQAAVRTPDGMRVYFLFGDNIYNLIYNIGIETEAHFMTTFDMMIKSFRLMAPGS